jgi:hypothetical protein
MPGKTMTDEQIKRLLKSAITEVLEEHRDLFREIVEEALEDLGLVRAIEEGMKSKDVDRKEVLDLIEDKT